MPRPTYNVPSETTNDGTRSLAYITPVTSPMPRPIPSATGQAQTPISDSSRVLGDSRIQAIPDAPITPCTDRSIDPIWITIVVPTTMISGTDIWNSTFCRFRTLANRGFRKPKMTNSTAIAKIRLSGALWVLMKCCNGPPLADKAA